MKTLRLLSFIVCYLLFVTCEKENNNIIKGQLIIRETNQPIRGLLMQFDVANGSGFFGSVDRAKYSAISDENGYFSFVVDDNDIDNFFYVNDNSSGNHCWPNFDTTGIHYKYMLVDNDRYISKDVKTKLIYSPRGVMDFYVTKETFAELNVDTVIVKSLYDADTIIETQGPYNTFRNKTLYVEPSQNHTFDFIAIKNGISLKNLKKEIFVRHVCSHELGTPGSFYEVKFK